MAINYHGGLNKLTLSELARNLRHSSTDGEALLWRLLRNRQVAGAKFRRQHQYGPYILDFFCDERKVVVEVDGDQHFTASGAAPRCHAE